MKTLLSKSRRKLNGQSKQRKKHKDNHNFVDGCQMRVCVCVCVCVSLIEEAKTYWR